jgi:3-dehydroquinate dehydratase-2
MIKVMVIHGPNLDLLGEREPEIYGSCSLADINAAIAAEAKLLGLEVRCEQSNSEGGIIDLIHEARTWANAIIINPAGYTHTSVAIYDALRAVRMPAIEVHLSNVAARPEEFRHRSLTGAACVGMIAGFHTASYTLALRAVKHLADQAQL